MDRSIRVYESGNYVLRTSGTLTKQDKILVRLVDCGSCGAMHPSKFAGDCRDDANRYANPQDWIERNHCA